MGQGGVPKTGRGLRSPWPGPSAPQLEKVLQQGDISECCEPYMVMKEADAVKVGVGELTGGGGFAGQVPGVLHRGRLHLPTEQRQAGEAAPGR